MPSVNKRGTQLQNAKVQVFIRIHRNIRIPSAFLRSPCREPMQEVPEDGVNWYPVLDTGNVTSHLRPSKDENIEIPVGSHPGIVLHFPVLEGSSPPTTRIAFHQGLVNQGYEKNSATYQNQIA